MNYQELQEAKQTFRLHTLEKDYKPFYKDRKEFVRRFSPKKIASMTIDEYVEGKQSKNSFCYLLERKLKPLGSISGINSSIFGVWYSAEQQGYKFDSRFGNDYKEAYKFHSHYPKSPAKAEEMAVKSKDEELEFPTVDSGDIQFVDLQLTSGKQTTTSKTHSATPSPDYEKEARKYKKLGDRGESFVYKAEIRRLKEELSITEAKAKKLIKWASRESDAYGYDIQSVNKDKTPRYIEVKATWFVEPYHYGINRARCLDCDSLWS